MDECKPATTGQRPVVLAICLLIAANAFAGTLVLDGMVLEVNLREQTILVSHKEVPGVMPAMTMPVHVGNARELSGLRSGMRIRFELITSRGGSEARKLRIQSPGNSIEEDGRKVPLAAPPQKVAIGAEVPDFILTSHDGETFRLKQTRGKVTAIQFLYTRCPLPEVCPRLAATFARLQKRFDGQDLALLTITLDPRYDTAQVLSRYAGFYRAGPMWRFLTGSEEQIRAAAGSLGIVYWPEDGVITHTSTISIVGRSGRLEAQVEGLSFTAQQLGDLIAVHLAKEAR